MVVELTRTHVGVPDHRAGGQRVLVRPQDLLHHRPRAGVHRYHQRGAIGMGPTHDSVLICGLA